jgi:hypothetical protein
MAGNQEQRDEGWQDGFMHGSGLYFATQAMIAADGARVQAELGCWCDGCAIGLAAYARHAGWYILTCSR